jgi:hypothetical protein
MAGLQLSFSGLPFMLFEAMMPLLLVERISSSGPLG